MGGSTLTGMDAMMVGWWLEVGESHIVKMHYVVGCFLKIALSGQNMH